MSDLIERAREASTLKYQYHTIHVPTILIRMADEADKAAAELSALQALHAAGSAPYDAEIDRLQKRCAGLEEESAALRADAERYRWLREKSRDHVHPADTASFRSGHGVKVIYQWPGVDPRSQPTLILCGKSMDQAIAAALDSARAKESGGG